MHGSRGGRGLQLSTIKSEHSGNSLIYLLFQVSILALSQAEGSQRTWPWLFTSKGQGSQRGLLGGGVSSKQVAAKVKQKVGPRESHLVRRPLPCDSLVLSVGPVQLGPGPQERGLEGDERWPEREATPLRTEHSGARSAPCRRQSLPPGTPGPCPSAPGECMYVRSFFSGQEGCRAPSGPGNLGAAKPGFCWQMDWLQRGSGQVSSSGHAVEQGRGKTEVPRGMDGGGGQRSSLCDGSGWQ